MSIRLLQSNGSVLSRVRQLAPASALVLAIVVQPGCTSAQLDGVSPSYLIVNNLLAASGATPDSFGGTLASDVVTMVDNNGTRVPTVFEDLGQVSFTLGLKDPGSANSPTVPSSANFITVTRYHVNFVRADGRNTPGVDVPYPFDGGLTATVTASGGTSTMTLVRVQAKSEAPLAALRNFGGADVISTIAEVTFYGTDQAGREVKVTAKIGVNFSDWGDPS